MQINASSICVIIFHDWYISIITRMCVIYTIFDHIVYLQYHKSYATHYFPLSSLKINITHRSTDNGKLKRVTKKFLNTVPKELSH